MIVNEIQLGSMHKRGTIDAAFILRRRQENNAKGKKLYMCLADIDKAFDRSPKKYWNGQ